MRMSIEGPSPKRRAEFVPGRPEGSYARRVISDGIHTQEYEVLTPEGEAIPVHPADLAREGIPWAGSQTVTPDDPAYRRIIEAAYRTREMTPPEKQEPETGPQEPEEEKSTHFIPGREAAVAERVFAADDEGRLDISKQSYRVRFSDGETVQLDPDDLAAEGIETEGSRTIFPSDREYPNLLEAAFRTREGTTRAQEQQALKDAIRSYAGTAHDEIRESAAEAQPETAETEPVDAHERWENRGDVRHGNERRHGAQREASDAETVSAPPQEPSSESRPGPESASGPEPRHERRAQVDHARAHEGEHAHDHGHDHTHGHGDHHHGESWHLPRNRSEAGELGIAVLIGAWNLVKALYHLHQWMVHATGYILTGDSKHPWQTLWKNVSGEFKKGLGLKSGGGHGGGGGGHGGGHGH